MNAKRVFFAILLPKSLHQSLSDMMQSLKDTFPKKDIRWIEVDNLHVTLQFVNSIPDEQISFLVKQVHHALKNELAFQLELGGVEWFPGSKHPKVLALSVQPQETLLRLSEVIKPILDSLNIITSSHEFRGHMSLGRLNHNDIPRELLTQVKMPDIRPVAVNAVYLIESKPAQGGRVYHVLEEFKLV